MIALTGMPEKPENDNRKYTSSRKKSTDGAFIVPITENGAQNGDDAEALPIVS
jgi:hypothetical protein